jgi:hypothetical protein
VAAIERLGLAAGLAVAPLLRAAIAWRRGDGAGARALLARADDALSGEGLLAYAAAARRHRGALAGDAALVAEGDGLLAAQGARHPARFAAMLAPGFARFS